MCRETILVTGGTGFIGRPLTEALVKSGYDVHVISSKGTPILGATVHEFDLLGESSADELLGAIQASLLVHLAWFVQPGQVWNTAENLRWVGASLELLLAFASQGGRRAVLAGSCSEYGPWGGVCNEATTPIAPSNLYGVSKAALGSMAIASAEHIGLAVAWARIFSAYGPREHPSRLVSSLAKHLLLGEEAPCSTGHQKRDYLSTEDIAGALLALLESDVKGPVNVGSGEPLELKDLIALTAEIAGRPDLVRLGAVTPPPDDPPVLVADVGRLREEVGWQPSVPLREGLERTVECWRDHLAAK
jgi:nucleoside-diphosphate-sugar epimerase